MTKKERKRRAFVRLAQAAEGKLTTSLLCTVIRPRNPFVAPSRQRKAGPMKDRRRRLLERARKIDQE